MQPDEFDALLASTIEARQAVEAECRKIIRELRMKPRLIAGTRYDLSGEFVEGFEEDWTK